MKREPQAVALFIVTVAESRNFFDWFLPSPYDVAVSTDNGADYVPMIRRGEIQATTAAVGVGVVASLLMEDPLPLVGIGIACTFLIYQYEASLKRYQRRAKA